MHSQKHGGGSDWSLRYSGTILEPTNVTAAERFHPSIQLYLRSFFIVTPAEHFDNKQTPNWSLHRRPLWEVEEPDQEKKGGEDKSGARSTPVVSSGESCHNGVPM